MRYQSAKAAGKVIFIALIIAAVAILGAEKTPLGPYMKDGIYPARARAHGWNYSGMAEVKNGMVRRIIRKSGDISISEA